MTRHGIIALLFALLLLAAAPAAYAQKTVAVGTSSCTMDAFGITADIIHCVRALVKPITNTMIQNVTGSIGEVMRGVCTLAIILMGFRVILGASPSAKKEIFTILKVSFVGIVATRAAEWIVWKDLLLDASFELGQLVTGSTSPDIYEQLDIYILRILGIDPTVGVTMNFFVGIGVVAAGLFFLGPIGAFVTMLILGILLAIIFAIVQIILLYITAILAVGFLMALGPIFLPLVFWRPTSAIFRKWFSYVISYTMQPIILAAFLWIFFQAIDGLTAALDSLYDEVYKLHKGESSTAGERSKTTATLFQIPDTKVDPENPEYQAWLQKKREETGDPNWLPPESGEMTGYLPQLPSMPVSLPGGAAYNIGAWLANKGINALGSVSGKLEVFYLAFSHDMLMKFTGAMFGLFIMLWYLISFLKEIPNIVQGLVGTQGVQSLNDMPLSNKVNNLQTDLSNSLLNNSSFGRRFGK